MNAEELVQARLRYWWWRPAPELPDGSVAIRQFDSGELECYDISGEPITELKTDDRATLDWCFDTVELHLEQIKLRTPPLKHDPAHIDGVFNSCWYEGKNSVSPLREGILSLRIMGCLVDYWILRYGHYRAYPLDAVGHECGLSIRSHSIKPAQLKMQAEFNVVLDYLQCFFPLHMGAIRGHDRRFQIRVDYPSREQAMQVCSKRYQEFFLAKVRRDR